MGMGRFEKEKKQTTLYERIASLEQAIECTNDLFVNQSRQTAHTLLALDKLIVDYKYTQELVDSLEREEQLRQRVSLVNADAEFAKQQPQRRSAAYTAVPPERIPEIMSLEQYLESREQPVVVSGTSDAKPRKSNSKKKRVDSS
jgi:hypothetical protein